MTPRELISTAHIPGGEEFRLLRRGGDFMIVLDRNELMSSRMSGSEEALAPMTCERLGDRKAPRILIGGYGMGFTLRAALSRLDKEARVTVAELVPQIIEWALGPMASLADGCLDDPRVTLRQQDVAMVIAERGGAYDAILRMSITGPTVSSAWRTTGSIRCRAWPRPRRHSDKAAFWLFGPPRRMPPLQGV